jgi:predicted ArsR family transcriptional regulator
VRPSRFITHLGILATLLDPTRRRLYRYVSERAEPVSRDDAAQAIGVSRAAAAHHLDRLVESGLLLATYRRLSQRTGPGAGRPSKLYRRSRRRFDVAIPERNHELLARLLAQSVEAGTTRSSGTEPAEDYGHSLGARARKRLTSEESPARLLKCVADVLDDLGFEPTPGGPGVIRTRNCPFDPVSRTFPAAVCHRALALTHGVIDGLGAETIEASREYGPDHCCIVLHTADRQTEQFAGRAF